MDRFLFGDAMPAASSGWYAHYEHLAPPSPGWKTCDVRGVIAAHERAWMDGFDGWHAELCAAGAARWRYWWASPASRPNLWAQSSTLKPLFFAAGLCQWASEHPNAAPVHVAGAPLEVARYVAEFTGTRGVGPARLAWRSLARGFRAFAGQAIRIVPYLLRRARIGRASVLIYSHIFQPAALKAGGDHYFGSILDRLDAERQGDTQVAYFVDGTSRPADAQAALSARRANGFLLLDALTAADMMRTFAASASVWPGALRILPGIRPVTLGAFTSDAFGAAYLSQHMWAQPPVMDIAIARALGRVLDRSGARSLVYPYEQKGLERMILAACAERSAPVRTIGYAHPAHTTAHLMLRSRPEPLAGPPDPDAVLTAGPLERDFLVDWGGKPAARVSALGSHRYRSPVEPRRSGRRPLRVLVLTGHGFELTVLAGLLGRRRDLFADDTVQVRKTAGGWFAAQEIGMRRLAELNPAIASAQGSLVDNITWCDVALFASTTAGIEAMLAGRLAIYVALHDVFEADPLLGHDDGAFARCEDEHHLADALARARGLTDDEYDAALHRQRALAERILAPIDIQQLLVRLAPPAGTTVAADRSAEPSRVHA